MLDRYSAYVIRKFRNSRPEMLYKKSVLKILEVFKENLVVKSYFDKTVERGPVVL